MPKSKVRKTTAYTPPPKRSPKKQVSPPWLAPTMLGLFLLGVAWLVVFYITNGDIWGMRELGNWNVAVGIGFILGGFGLSTKWH